MEQKEKNDRETFLTNIRQSILPYLAELAQTNPSHGQQVLLDRLEKNIGQITSPLIGKLSSRYLNLTPMEIKVATLVKEGIVNKEIVQILKVSLNTITSHRYKIRTKLALKNKNINLRSYLLSLEEEGWANPMVVFCHQFVTSFTTLTRTVLCFYRECQAVFINYQEVSKIL